MRLLSILFANWIVLVTYDGSVSAVLLCVLIAIVDYVFIRSVGTYVKKKHYLEIISAKTKMVSFFLNIVLTIVCSLLLYNQYLSPACHEVTDKFEQSMIMKGFDTSPGRISVAIPRSTKETMIAMSSNMEWCLSTFTNIKDTSVDGVSDTEQMAMAKVVKAQIKTKKAELAKHQQNNRHYQLIIAALLAVNLIRLILWQWTDTVAFIKRVRARYKMKRVNV